MNKCEAVTFSNGSWYCGRCNISGDNDEKPDDNCLNNNEIAERELNKIRMILGEPSQPDSMHTPHAIDGSPKKVSIHFPVSDYALNAV